MLGPGRRKLLYWALAWRSIAKVLRINLRGTLIGNRGSEDSDETPVIEIGVKVLSGKSGPGN